MPQIDAYRRDTGEKVRVPAHWFDHPKLGEPFSKTPRQKAREKSNTPTTEKAPVSGEKE